MLSSAEFTSGLLVNVFNFHRKSFYSRNSLSHINSYVAVQSTFGALFKKIHTLILPATEDGDEKMK